MRAALALILLASTSAFARSENRNVADFDAVHISAGIHATVELANTRSVVLEADDAVLRDLEAVVEDGELRVGFREGTRHWNRTEIRATIRTPRLHSIGASGGSVVRAELSRGDKNRIEASGGSEIHVRGADAATLSVHGSGGAVVEVSGRADALDVELSGGSRLAGRGLEVRDVDIEGSGGATGELRASGLVRGGLSGGSRIRVMGGARTRVHSSGGGGVDVED